MNASTVSKPVGTWRPVVKGKALNTCSTQWLNHHWAAKFSLWINIAFTNTVLILNRRNKLTHFSYKNYNYLKSRNPPHLFSPLNSGLLLSHCWYPKNLLDQVSSQASPAYTYPGTTGSDLFPFLLKQWQWGFCHQHKGIKDKPKAVTADFGVQYHNRSSEHSPPAELG